VLLTELARLQARNERTIQLAIRSWFGLIYRQISEDLKTKYEKSVTSKLTDWEFLEAEGRRIIKPAALTVMETGAKASFKQFGISASFDITNPYAIKAADKFCAELVTNVNKKTKAGIRTFISSGVKEGKPMPKIAKELRPMIGLTKPQVESVANFRERLSEKFPPAMVDKKVRVYTDRTHRRRANDIARTETARAQNIGYCQGLSELGVTQAEFRISPADYCEECEALNGKRFPIEEAEWIIPVHPKCRCAMLPVVGEKTVTQRGKYNKEDLPATMKAPEGLPPWKKYNALHPEQTTQESLYDWYKLKYEATDKLAPSGMKFLRANAKRFEAKSVKITKPIPGISGDVISPGTLRPAIPKPKPTALSRAVDGPLDDFEKYYQKYQGVKPKRMIRYEWLKQQPVSSLNEKQLALLEKYDKFWKDGVHRSVKPVRDIDEWIKTLSDDEWSNIKSWKAGSYKLRQYQMGQITAEELKAQLLLTDVKWG
jgi:SPP1 gp7 family putative phage head morphogenesis protein